MTVTMIIATADRPLLLRETLAGLASCQLPRPDLCVLVADNGTDPGTATVCAEDFPGLTIRHLKVERRGKSIALNAAVEAAASGLFVFTDDDVEFHPAWLVELHRAAREWPEHRLFGGRIVPRWPGVVPDRLDGSRFMGPLYTLLDLGDDERPVAGFRPFGPNMAARSSLFEEGIRFDEAIGPGSADRVSMGDETGIGRQLEAAGESAVYVPDSVVYHRVRDEQLALSWQLKRGISYGRMLEYLERETSGESEAPRWFGVPRFLFRKIASSAISAGGLALLNRPRDGFDRLMDAAVAIGRARQARRHGRMGIHEART